MRLLADENLEARVVRALVAAGHDIVSMSRLSPGLEDREVLEVARKDSRVILTRDKDYGDLVVHEGRETAGVILLRLRMHALEKAEHLQRVLPLLEGQVEGRFVVITERGVRIRTLPQ